MSREWLEYSVGADAVVIGLVELYRISGKAYVTFFNVPPENKDAVTTSAYQDQLNAGFPKVCEI